MWMMIGYIMLSYSPYSFAIYINTYCAACFVLIILFPLGCNADKKKKYENLLLFFVGFNNDLSIQ